MYYFCTFFDHRYLDRGLALYRSLQEHCSSFRLWILCMDQLSYDTLSQMSLSNAHLIALEDFERGDEELLKAKQNRTLIEYYFTCTPSLPLFILKNWPEIDMITYLDSDLFFFADPAPVYDEIANHSIAIIAHRFPPATRHFENHGIYNVGWISFKHDEYGLTCLRWWRGRCIEWCYTRYEDGRFADQKYLDDWPTRFQNVIVLEHKGANLANWNLANYEVQLVDENQILVDEQPLIFYHFHGLKRVTSWLYNPNLTVHGAKLTKVIRENIYFPYVWTLSNVIPEDYQLPDVLLRSYGSRWLLYLNRMLRLPFIFKDILTGNYLFVRKGRVV